MGTVPLVLGLVVAVVISAQIVLLMGGRRPLDKRLRDLGTGGDAFALLWAAVLTMGAVGAVIGSLLDVPGAGGAVGVVLALLTWTAAVVWAHRRPQPPARHQSSQDK
ncbi:hypothetical protein EV649_3269 [Kribbella sp. VKM Ac-2569]|uniref:hypothetical protein n=1 Tax=Kribbella sp. VKM Ac-2569 TaxID=2512220 RepID=UPI00102BE610|nr:hypothetical protein [Kribbella sp. VKM Ac-2569]RZT20127.1 hypothetical protein EV649_3269 [Kribbella sp. VKM Ac-2569]